MRSFLWTTALVASAGLAAQPASAAAAARTFDLVTYTAPKGFTVVEKKEGGGRVELTKASATSYCIVAIYSSTPASSDLEASFAAEWEAVALKTIDAVDAPEPTTRKVGNTRAAVGSATSTAGGQPISAMLIVLDAGASVLSMVVLTPTEDAFEAYEAEVESMLSGMVVKHVKRTEEAPAGVAVAAPQTDGGRLVIPAPTRTITVADLAGEWGQNDGITTTYVDRYTGAYAGYESLHFTNKWTITSQGGISLDFFGIQNGKKISEKSSGTVTLSGGVLVIKMSNTQRYVLRGWLERPEMTVMTLNGPWYDDPIPANIFTNPAQGTNLNQNWVRKK